MGGVAPCASHPVPDTPGANVRPGQTSFPMMPVNRIMPCLFLTNVAAALTLQEGALTASARRSRKPPRPCPTRGHCLVHCTHRKGMAQSIGANHHGQRDAARGHRRYHRRDYRPRRGRSAGRAAVSACPVLAWSIALNQRIAADQAAAGPHAPTTEAAGGKLYSASFDFHDSSRLSGVPLCKPLCVPIRHQFADNPSLLAKQWARAV